MWNSALWIAALFQAPAGTPAQEPWIRPANAPIEKAAQVDEPSPAAATPTESPAARGELPKDTSPEARAAWERLMRATGTEGPPIAAFDLTFDGRARQNQKQSNDFNKTRYRYLGPGYVRMTFSSGVEHMRGPEGDWLFDPNKGADGDRVPLRGRQYTEDRKQLTQTLAIGRNFASLTSPSQLRIRGLRELEKAPGFLPTTLATKGQKLQWLEVDSPDFALVRDDALREPGRQEPQFRALLGLDRETALPALAVIHELQGGGAMVHRTALLVELSDYRELDGFRVPFRLATHPPDFQQNKFQFALLADLELWLLTQEASVRPSLTPKDFVPPPR